MTLKYKLLKPLPDAKIGTIFTATQSSAACYSYSYTDNEGSIQWMSRKVVETSNTWFSKYVTTTADKVEVYANDTVYAVLTENISDDCWAHDSGSIKLAVIASFKSPHWKFFLSKTLAIDYSIAIKVIENNSFVKLECGAVVKPHDIEVLNKNIYLHYCNNDGKVYSVLLNGINLMSSSEVLTHFQSLGWTKGAKFKSPGGTYTAELSNIKFRGKLLSVDLTNESRNELDSFDYLAWDLLDCELLENEKLEYPKNWEDFDKHGFAFNGVGMYSGLIRKNSSVANCGELLYATPKQANSAKAFAKLSILHAELVRVWEINNATNYTVSFNKYNEATIKKWHINLISDGLRVDYAFYNFVQFPFPTEELAEFALDTYRDLWKAYFQLS